jgi:hypothetical protein
MRRPALAFALAFAVAFAAALALPVAASAAPAAPSRTVPADEVLYGVSCEWSVIDDMVHVFALDGDTGDADRIGSVPRSGPTYFCVVGVAWDRQPSSCTAYAAALDPDLKAALVRIDLVTGASAPLVPMTVSGPRVSASGFAIDASGVAWVVSAGFLNTVNLTTGVLTPIAPVSVAGLAWSEATGELLGFTDSAVFSVDRATGASTLVADLSTEASGTFITALTVDGDGVLWVGITDPATTGLDQAERVTVLWSVDGGVAEREGPILPGGTKLETFALASLSDDACALPTLPLPPGSDPVVPTLAATGLEDATPILLPIAAFALALGALLVSSARRARPASGRRRGSLRGSR